MRKCCGFGSDCCSEFIEDEESDYCNCCSLPDKAGGLEANHQAGRCRSMRSEYCSQKKRHDYRSHFTRVASDSDCFGYLWAHLTDFTMETAKKEMI